MVMAPEVAVPSTLATKELTLQNKGNETLTLAEGTFFQIYSFTKTRTLASTATHFDSPQNIWPPWKQT